MKLFPTLGLTLAGEVAAGWGEVVLRGEEQWEGVGGRPPPSGGRDLPILGRIRSVSPSIFPCHDFATLMHRIVSIGEYRPHPKFQFAGKIGPPRDRWLQQNGNSEKKIRK